MPKAFVPVRIGFGSVSTNLSCTVPPAGICSDSMRTSPGTAVPTTSVAPFCGAARSTSANSNGKASFIIPLPHLLAKVLPTRREHVSSAIKRLHLPDDPLPPGELPPEAGGQRACGPRGGGGPHNLSVNF